MVSLDAARARLDRLLDETARALAPARFTAEPARPARGPCHRPDGRAGSSRLLATRFAARDPADPDDPDGADAAALAGQVARLWRDHGCGVRVNASQTLGHEVVATTPEGGILVFGIAAHGMTLGGETACVPDGCTGQQVSTEPHREEHRVVEDVSERQGSLVDVARGGDEFRRVVVTGPHMQLAVMTIPPGGEVGEEIHEGTDQFLFFVEGQGEARIDGARSAVPEGGYVFVPAGTRHNFVNTGRGPLRIATTYAPPEHPPGTVHATKAVADAEEAHHH